jgi:uncharacterized membrane protein
VIRYGIVVIQNSLITAILLAMIQAAFPYPADPGRKKCFVLCRAAGILGAAVFAVLRRTTAINRGMVNTWVLCAAITAGLVFMVLLWRGKGASRSVGFSLASAALAGTLLLYALPPLFLLPSDFVMAGQSVFSTEFLVNLTGALGGLLVVFLAGLMVFHAGTQTARAAGTGFRILLSAALAVNMANQAAGVIQFLMARRILPLHRGLFKVIMLAVNNPRFFVFAGTGIAALLPLGLLAGDFSRRRSGALAGNGVPPNPAAARKRKALARRNRRRNAAALVFLGLSVFTLTGLKTWNERAVALSPAEPFTLAGEEIIIPVTQIEDGHLHRFAWNAQDNTEVRFIVVKKSASAWGVGLDACDICGSTGYYERRDGIVCRLCDVVMNKSTIGFKGGCNPVPLAYTVRDGAMVVRLEDLEREKGRFQ